MKAKEYLLQLATIDAKIKNKTREIALWGDCSTYEVKQLTGEISRLREQKKEIVAVMEKLPLNLYNILHWKYVLGLRYADITQQHGISYTTATTTHSKAIKAVQMILDERENK